jgi:selenocysteine-specific elongation factor
MLLEAGSAGLLSAELPVRLGVRPADVASLVAESHAWSINGRLFAGDLRAALASQLRAIVERFHQEHPLDSGAPQQWLRSRIRAPDSVVSASLELLVSGGELLVEQGSVRLPTFAPILSSSQRAIADSVVACLGAAASEPPSLDELSAELGQPVELLASICRALARDDVLIAVEANRYYLASVVRDLRDQLVCGMSPTSDYGPTDLRPFIGLTRKFLIPFLEYCDREGYTIRDGLGRRRRGTF